MFDAVRNNKKIVQIFLALITLPFAFWGVDSYIKSDGSGNAVATVGDVKVSPQEFQNAVREQQDRMRAQLGAQFRAEMLDTPEAKGAILNGLVAQRILAMESVNLRLGVSDDQLREVISSIPALQQDGSFSMSRYEQALKAQGLTQAGFEARLRSDLTLQQIPLAVRASSINSKVVMDRWVALQLEERTVAEAAIKADAYVSQVKLAGDAVQKYYDANKKEFELPEQAKVEFVVLSQEAIASRVTVSDADVKAAYDARAERFRQGEERRASHILIPVAKDAPAAEVKSAQDKAADVLAQVKKAPADFAKLAKQYSGDPGSAAAGGDLGFFGKGAMVKSFEDSAFSLKENQVSELVRSDFGFHIIKLTGIKASQVQSMDAVKAVIVSDLKSQAAARQYAEAADTFTNMVYEQADSLKPVVDRFKLNVEQAGWVTKGQAVKGVLAHPKLMTALFSDDVTKKKHNTEAVEVAPNTLVSARVVEYKPAAQRPLAEVQAALTQKLVRQEAAKLAQKDGEEKLAKLQKGEAVALNFGAARNVSRVMPAGVPNSALTGVFKAAADKLPAYAGGLADDGSYLIYKVSGVKAGNLADSDQKVQTLRAQYANFRAEDDLIAYMGALRQRYPVTVNKTVLEARER